jgi:hypothetical protein
MATAETIFLVLLMSTALWPQKPDILDKDGTGSKNYDETVPHTATIKVYHYREHASVVELSLAPELGR